MKTVCIIPARIGSQRLSNKPLQRLGDKPIIQHTFEKACACNAIDTVAVATDSELVADCITALGGQVIMTSDDINTGSDRVAVAAREFADADVIINLQGDEPFIKPHMLASLIEPFAQDAFVKMTTLAGPLTNEATYFSPDKVKVIVNNLNDALYFSRAPIPYYRQDTGFQRVFHHMGVYAFNAQFLQTYTTLAQTPLELAESLEQLRALEHGFNIRVCQVMENTLEINTPEELRLANETLDKG